MTKVEIDCVFANSMTKRMAPIPNPSAAGRATVRFAVKGEREVISSLGMMIAKITAVNNPKIAQIVASTGRVQWLGMQFHEPLAASFTMRGLKPLESVVKRRDELIEENKEALEKGDIMTMSAIEKELVELAKKEISDDPSMDLYYSGARESACLQHSAQP